MKKKEIIICILAIIMLIFSVSNVFAMDGLDDDDNGIIKQQPTINTTNDLNEDNTTTEIKYGNKDEGITQVNNDMPNTGIEDVPVIAVGICVISAVVAYTQIKKYKNV